MIILKTPDEIEKMNEANKIVHQLLDHAEKIVVAGITTAEIDLEIEELLLASGALPAFKGLYGYKHATCISINDEIVHGVPSERIVKDGDIVGVDIGTGLNGYYGDAARTFMIGEVSWQAEKIVKETKRVLDGLVENLDWRIKEGQEVRLQDICRYLDAGAKLNGFKAPRNLGGHGISKNKFHDDPFIPNYIDPLVPNVRLRAGMVLAIEPMFCEGLGEHTIDADGWTCRTKDGGLSAHWEYSLAIIKDGVRILGK